MSDNRNFPTAPTAPAGARPGLRVTPVILCGALAVVVLMVFTVVFLATRQPDKPAAAAVPSSKPVQVPTQPVVEPTPSEQASTEDPPPTGTARFTKDVQPCPLVDQSLVRKYTFFPDKKQIYQEECEWQTLAPGHGMPGNNQWLLKLYVKVFPGDLAKAQQQFLAQRQDAVLLSKTFTPADPPIGDASWTTLYTLDSGNDHGPTTATVGVRVSNAVIMVTYQRRVTEDPQGRLMKGALEIAKTAADKLQAAG
ncbi:hypothetical protein [Nonomuraea sediminis]|uniref:hypothetical protein n=1 Tax=Nonomuraea sediminis TaxID=2835864 RepID=UPI001BDC38D4|nr:hypothetical protein [Nonomuraea sediminis]